MSIQMIKGIANVIFRSSLYAIVNLLILLTPKFQRYTDNKKLPALYSSGLEDESARQFFIKIFDKISVMSLVHKKLYGSLLCHFYQKDI